MEHHQHSITKPIINCHTHIFTGDHVPPYLAKTFLIWPFYYLLNLTFIVKIFRWWYRGPDTIKYKGGFKQLLGWRNRLHILSTRLPGFVKFLAGLFITVQVIFILYDWIAAIVPPEESKLLGWFSIIRTWLADHYLLLPINNSLVKIALVLFVLFFISWGRNFILFIFKKLWSFFGMLPGKQTKEMLKRYLTIGRYAFHERQSTILGKLKNQYPKGTGFVILPMDMESMDAGTIKKSYRQQMEELARLKNDKDHANTIFPFVFADPVKIIAEPDYFQYEINNGSVVLKECFVKEYIEEKRRMELSPGF